MKKVPFGRSNSAPADMETSKMIGTRIDRYGSYSDGSVSSTGSSVSYMDHLVSVPIAPPSRYHTSARFHRRVTFNERVEVFELPFIQPEEMPVEYKQKIKRIKNDTIKFHEQVNYIYFHMSLNFGTIFFNRRLRGISLNCMSKLLAIRYLN